MDARIAIEDALGLRAGDAHIIRNAGGLVTDDVIRSLIVSQQLMGTDEIILIEHSGCGLHGASEADIRARAAHVTGASPDSIDIDVRGVPRPRGEPARTGRPAPHAPIPAARAGPWPHL